VSPLDRALLKIQPKSEKDGFELNMTNHRINLRAIRKPALYLFFHPIKFIMNLALVRYTLEYHIYDISVKKKNLLLSVVKLICSRISFPLKLSSR
jgi:hypothetical protein